MPSYQPRQYPRVPMPQAPPIDPMGSLRDLASLASTSQTLTRNRKIMADEDRTRASQQAVETALKASRGDVDDAVTALQTGGRWSEAATLSSRADEIRTKHQQTLAAGLTTAREGFKTATQLFQGIEAAESPEEKSRLYAAARPQITEMLPGLADYVPETLDQDPGFVARMIPFGLSASEVAMRQEKAVEALNRDWKQAGNQLDRDTAVIKHLIPEVEAAENGEDIGQFLDMAKRAYGASPALAERIGELPTGPLDEATRTRMLNSLRTPPREPPDYALVPTERPDGETVYTPRREAAGQRVPVTAPRPAAVNVGSAERDRSARIATLDQARRDQAQTRTPMTDDEYDTRKARINASYQRQIGAAPPLAPDPAGRRGDINLPAEPQAPGAADVAQVTKLLATKAAGRDYTLTDGSVWRKLKDGTVIPASER